MSRPPLANLFAVHYQDPKMLAEIEALTDLADHHPTQLDSAGELTGRLD